MTTTTITNPDGTTTVEKVEEIHDDKGNVTVNKITNGENKTLTYKK